DMASGLDALIAMRHRLIAKQQILGDKEASSSATVDLTGRTIVAGELVEHKQSEEKVPSPQSSPAKKRKRVPRGVTEEFAEEALEGIEAVDSTIRIQRMLLRAATHCRDVQREVAGIPKLQNMLSEKENRIKTLGSKVTELEAEAKSRGAEVLSWKGWRKPLMRKLRLLRIRLLSSKLL
ncbi:hypothetical protein PIB30_082707, partial [Stylosanthes scabra]|nr:hypothetical protein [Stylosanthes scabra]